MLDFFPYLHCFLQIAIADHLPALTRRQVKIAPCFQMSNIKYQGEEFFSWLLMTTTILD